MRRILINCIASAIVALLVCLVFVQVNGLLTAPVSGETTIPPDYTPPGETETPEPEITERPRPMPGDDFSEFMDEQLFDEDRYERDDAIFYLENISVFAEEGKFKTIGEAFVDAYLDDFGELQVMHVSYTKDDISLITLSFYPYEDYLGIVKETALDDPFSFFSSTITSIRKMAIFEDVLYYFVDEGEEIFVSGNAAEYQRIFDDALNMLNIDSMEI